MFKCYAVLPNLSHRKQVDAELWLNMGNGPTCGLALALNLDNSKSIDVLSHFLIPSGITSIEQHFDKVNDEK